MKLQHEFTIPLARPEAWSALLDIGRVARSFPGATLETVTAEEFTGSVTLKLGPILMTYAGTATFVDRDEASYTLKVDAAGRDKRGAGTARALVTASLLEDGAAATRVRLDTDFAITGKPAQFGRGVIEEVSNNILGQFAENLRANLTSPEDNSVRESVGATNNVGQGKPTTETVTNAEVASLNVLSPAILMPLGKRILPALVGLGAGLFLMGVMSRRRRDSAPPIIYVDLRGNRQSLGVPVIDRQ